MNTPFLKMEGTGNDFLVIDDRSGSVSDYPVERWADLCARRTGIGADGVLLLRPGTDGDIGMVYLNADGRESTMCGNGARCLAWAAAMEFGLGRELTLESPMPAGWELPAGIGSRQVWSLTLEAADGPHHALGWGENVMISIGDPDPPLERPLDPAPVDRPGLLVDTGVPHYVVTVPDPAGLDLTQLGPAIRHHPDLGPAGANATFIAAGPDGEGRYHFRTWERGVEAETLSCGTGAAAAAAVLARAGTPSPISLRAAGGQLRVHFSPGESAPRNLWLEGPIRLVYRGALVD
jgi:diaminopimelate epimerase